MPRFLIGRLSAGVATVAAVVSLVFLLTHFAPADPVLIMLGSNYDPQTYRQLVHQYGLDLPLWRQYLDYMWGVVHGDLGLSYRYVGTPVTTILAQGIPVSMQLGGMAIAVMVAVGVPLGVVAATRRNTALDAVVTGGAMLAHSVPTFVLIPIGMLLFGVKLHWLPVAGWGQPAEAVLPVTMYAAGGTAFVVRLTRAAMLDVLSQEYLTTARAKGLREGRVVFVHAFRNAVLPVVSGVAPLFALIVTGAFIVESLYNIPGIGFVALQATQMNDYPVIAGLSVLVASAVVGANIATDMLYHVLDPRVRVR